MSRAELVIRYGLFAAIATVANLAAQRAVLAGLGDARGFVPAMMAGTAVGLVVKYLLDKRWIFGDRSRGLAAHGRKFTLYSLMGVATTFLFWAVETAFWLAWRTDAMRELGAVIGLAIGYTIKYRLDRRFVFAEVRT
jgi:putative flippase GtrA